MKELHGEGLASHTDPESCVVPDTCEVPEQRRWFHAGGGHGGKTTDQGEHGADGRVPDTKLGERVS
jgi:hypothetical protein